jgi:hypothetical protein
VIDPRETDDELDFSLELQPLEDEPAAPAADPAAATPAAPATAASPAAASATPSSASDADLVPGQWVWQYGAPAPPPPFSAVFFSGHALGELYRFFACGLLVVVGCLLPWGKSVQWAVQHGESTLGYGAAPAGYEVPVGALCLVIALWLLFTSCYGIYTGRQKVLPVFLMLIPAYASWTRTLSAWKELSAIKPALDTRQQLVHLFDVAGTGVLVTLIGSTIIVLSLLVVILKVFRKEPGEAAARPARKPKEEKARPARADKAPRGAAPADSATGAEAPSGEASASAPPAELATASAESAAGQDKDRKRDRAAGKDAGKGDRRGRRR